MELSDLVGLHELSGVDTSSENIKKEWGDGFENCQVINFILDGVAYQAIEDPQDDYRSSMKEVRRTETQVKNTFAPQKVFCRMRGKTQHGYNSDILDLYDAVTTALVLSVGTANTDDYYPYFVAEFTPENMAINAAKG